MRIGCVELLELWNVLDPLHARCISYGCDDLVGAQVDHIRLLCCEMGRNEIVVALIDRQIVKALSAWTRQVELCDLLKGLSECTRGGKKHNTKKTHLPNRSEQIFFCINSSQKRSCLSADLSSSPCRQ